MKHVIVPYGPTNSSVRTRAFHWIDRLQRAGLIDSDDVVVYGPGQARCKRANDEPVLLLRNARRMTRGGTERRLLCAGRPGVYDLDDGLPWDDGKLPGLGRWWKRPFPRSLMAERSATAADRVVVGNEVLAEWAAGRCDDVRIIPTCVEPSDYRRRTSWEIHQAPLIGWIGSPATEPYLLDIAPALATACASTGARVELISGPGDVPGPLRGFTDRVAWTPDVVERIARWDVGVMPLRDGVYERAKCGYKLLQYAASGVPSIASPVGINRGLLMGMDGLAATSTDEWTEALIALLAETASRRAERAHRGFEVAEAYSYEVWEQAWIDAVGW